MTQSPTAAETAVLYNGRAAEMLIAYADPATGKLHTLQFEETRADLGEASRTVAFDWNRFTPPGTTIVIPESGHPLSKLDDYWLVYQTEAGLAGQSAQNLSPIVSPLEPDEWIIDRPLVTANRELHAYTWRQGQLVRHTFGPRAAVEAVFDIGARPLRSICAPLPGDDGGTALIGYLNQEDDGISASVVYVRGTKVMRLDGRAEGRYRLMSRHRMAAHVGRKGRPALALVAISLDTEVYALLEARFDFATRECVWRRTNLETVPPGSLESARVFYYKSQDAPDPFVLAVDQTGNLICPKRRNVQLLRPGVGNAYGYPVLTTISNRYEAFGSGDGIELKKL